jgi:hypothetical protein
LYDAAWLTSTTGKDSEKSGTFITHKSFSRLEKKRPITEPNIPSTGKAKYIMTAVSTSTNLHCQSFHRLQLVSMVGVIIVSKQEQIFHQLCKR